MHDSRRFPIQGAKHYTVQRPDVHVEFSNYRIADVGAPFPHDARMSPQNMDLHTELAEP